MTRRTKDARRALTYSIARPKESGTGFRYTSGTVDRDAAANMLRVLRSFGHAPRRADPRHPGGRRSYYAPLKDGASIVISRCPDA